MTARMSRRLATITAGLLAVGSIGGAVNADAA